MTVASNFVFPPLVCVFFLCVFFGSFSRVCDHTEFFGSFSRVCDHTEFLHFSRMNNQGGHSTDVADVDG